MLRSRQFNYSRGTTREREEWMDYSEEDRRTTDMESVEEEEEEGEEYTPFEFVSRAEWGAPKPKWGLGASLLVPIQNVFCLPTQKRRCFDTRQCRNEMMYLVKRHMQSAKCPDIKYNFVVGGDGRVYEGRGWLTRPGLPLQHETLNKYSLFIAYAGIFNKYTMPTEVMVEARDKLVFYGVERGFIDRDYTLYSHTDWAGRPYRYGVQPRYSERSSGSEGEPSEPQRQNYRA